MERLERMAGDSLVAGVLHNTYHGLPVNSAHPDFSPLFRIFFQGQAAGLMSREATMLLMAPRGSVVAVVAGAASGTKHIWGICQQPFARARRLRSKALAPSAKSLGIASQKLYRAPGWPFKESWKSGTS